MLKYIHIIYHRGKINIRPCRTEPPSKLNSGLWCLGFFIELINVTVMGYQDIQRPLLREEGDGAPASSGTQ